MVQTTNLNLTPGSSPINFFLVSFHSYLTGLNFSTKLKAFVISPSSFFNRLSELSTQAVPPEDFPVVPATVKV